MGTTVNIMIKGIAICYKKDIGAGVLRWRVLFPFDKKKCHPINFTLKRDDGPNLPLLPVTSPPETKKSLANANGVITIASPQSISGNSTETPNFRNHVFDLTKDATTHPSLQLINTPANRWRRETVVMKINVPAIFSVDEYLENLTDERAILKEDDGSGNDVDKGEIKPLAHSIKATIQLSNTESLTVSDGADLAVIPAAANGGVYTLVFDNDCKEKRPGMNDMDMFYRKTIIDPAQPRRQFRIGERFLMFEDENRAIPPSLADGKPCLAVQISKGDGFVEV